MLNSNRLGLRSAIKHMVARNGLTRGGVLFFVFLPSILAFVYLSFFASDMYTSVTKFALESEKKQGIVGMELASQIFSSIGPSNTYAYIVQDYIKSEAILHELDRQLDLKGHYSDPSNDVVFRLDRESSREDFLDYWQRMVEAKFELDSGIISVSVEAFTPEMAKAIGEAILVQSEELVNEINERAQQDTLMKARDEVALAEKRVAGIREKLTRFRDAHSILDARASAEGMQFLLSGLEEAAIEAKIRLKQGLSHYREESPQVQSLKSNLQAVEQQLAEEKERVASRKEEGEKLSSVMSEYEQLAVESEFAQKQYVSALSSLEIARMQASSKSQYVVAYQQPTLPDEPLFPRPFYHSFLIFIISWMLFFIVSFVIAAIREHAGF